MVQITIDEATRQKLFASGEDVIELVDESGNLLGRVLPQAAVASDRSAHATPEISEEEYQRRLHSDEPGMSTEELLAHLRGKT